MLEKKVQIVADTAPALRHQSQAIRSENLVYVSGQTGCDPATGSLAEGLAAQTERHDPVRSRAEAQGRHVVELEIGRAHV